MPPKTRKKNNTQKVKKRPTGRITKNTTFKNKVFKGGRGIPLEDALKNTLTNEFIEQQLLINQGDRRYSILIDFCNDGKFVVNTTKFLYDTMMKPDEDAYEDKLTIPKKFEKGTLLEIIIKVKDDKLMYATRVTDNTKFNDANCRTGDSFPVIYQITDLFQPKPGSKDDSAVPIQTLQNELDGLGSSDDSKLPINTKTDTTLLINARKQDKQDKQIDYHADIALRKAEEEAKKKKQEEAATKVQAVTRGNIARKEEARKEEARKEEARKEEARKEEARKEEARKEEARKEEARKEDARKEDARKEDARKEEARKAEARKAEEAVTKIQAVARGNISRKEQQKSEDEFGDEAEDEFGDEAEDEFGDTQKQKNEDDKEITELLANLAALKRTVDENKTRNLNIADNIHELKTDINELWKTEFITDNIIKTIGEDNNTNLQNIFDHVLCRLYPRTFGKYEAPSSEGFLGLGEGSYNTKRIHTEEAIEKIKYYLGVLITNQLDENIVTEFIRDVSEFINDFKNKDSFNYIEGCHIGELVKGKCPVDKLKCKTADENTQEAKNIITNFKDIGARLKTNQYNEKKLFSKDFEQITGKLQALIQHINNAGRTTNLSEIKTNIRNKNANDDIQPTFIDENVILLERFIKNYVFEKQQGGKKTRKNRCKTKRRKTKRHA